MAFDVTASLARSDGEIDFAIVSLNANGGRLSSLESASLGRPDGAGCPQQRLPIESGCAEDATVARRWPLHGSRTNSRCCRAFLERLGVNHLVM
jgi:hypothetical protein